MRRVDQFWWVLLACAVVLVGVAAMAQDHWMTLEADPTLSEESAETRNPYGWSWTAVQMIDSDNCCQTSVDVISCPCPETQWTDEIIVVSEDYYLCHGLTLDYAQCDDGDLIGYSSEQGMCCVKQTTARLGLRSDGVVVWRKHD